VSLTIAILKESAALETRVAASPDTVKKYVGAGMSVNVQSDAGAGSAILDDHFKDAGAKITKDVAETVKDADIILCVQPPAESDLKAMKKGAYLIGLMAPHKNETFLKAAKAAGVITMAMELVPRITRAQAMDVLSSQSNLAGYKAVLDATEHYGRAMPMMMTAAGTVPPAKVFVMGAGVAGLQAIATAKRLGAVVSATDVRPAAKEQVQSLGGSFVAVEDDEFKEAETSGGYAKEMSDAYKKKQQALIEETIKKQDIVITTALIPGRPAPELVSEEMVKSMKPGSVIVDLAAEQGGNCACTEKGKVVVKHDVTIVGHENMAGRLAASASSLYARNLQNLVMLMSKEGELAVDESDEIIAAIITDKKDAGKAPAKKAAAKKSATKKKAAKTSAAKKKSSK
jgi:NAD(P) transhydrogenase subunit alpha